MASTTNDSRLLAVDKDRKTAISDMNNQYNTMVNNTDNYYNELVEASKSYVDKQSELQQQQTDFAIEKIEQQKEQAKQDYVKEQKGAYVDYKNAINDYGVGAETRASNGMSNTGYSETSKITAFDTYQNRYASARQSYNQAILNYDNSMKDAKLQNSATLAEIAYNGLQKQLELALQGFQYKNTLLQEQFNNKLSLESLYDNRYNNVLSQINTENALAEQIRQYNETMAYQKERDKIADEQWEKEYQLSLANSRRSSSGSSGGGVSLSDSVGLSGNAISTDYYQGALNSDAYAYGTFGNGYQPKGISGHGTLKKTGEQIVNNTQTLSGESRKVTQNIWKAEDGTKWYWEGRQNKYLPYK